MKEKITKKAMIHNYICISVPYCALQSMLTYRNPDYYTSGVYGWNADCYIFGNYAIVIGYRPFGIKADSAICTKYNDKAKKIQKTAYRRLHKLIDTFIHKTSQKIKIKIFEPEN